MGTRIKRKIKKLSIGGLMIFRKESVKLFSPVNGRCISLEQVPDPIFSQKMVGDGVAFEFEENTVYSPCDGEIIALMPSNHAFGIRAKNGAEILVHIGLNTVNLNGQGFELLVRMNQKIKAHQPIIKLDRTFMKQNKINLTTPMVVTNLESYQMNFLNKNCVCIEDTVLKVIKK